MRICPQCLKETEELVCASDGFPTADSSDFRETRVDPLVQQIFQGRYRIEAPIGSGGMGRIYRATQLSMHRTVAIKVLLGELAANPEYVARFHREAAAISLLTHPNTVRVVDFGRSDDGILFIVMEHLEGLTLAEALGAGRAFSVDEVTSIARQTLKSLDEAHANGIVHRDLKPSNIFLASIHGEKDFVKVLDFGIASVRSGAGVPADLTQAGMLIGTPAYMAPERATGGRSDLRSDLYSLGATLYEVLAGRRPFDPASPAEVLYHHIHSPVPPIQDLAFDGSAGPLLGLVFACLAKLPTERPASAREALERLERRPASELALQASQTTVPLGEPASRKPSPALARWALSVSGVAGVSAALIALKLWGASWLYPCASEVGRPQLVLKDSLHTSSSLVGGAPVGPFHPDIPVVSLPSLDGHVICNAGAEKYCGYLYPDPLPGKAKTPLNVVVSTPAAVANVGLLARFDPKAREGFALHHTGSTVTLLILRGDRTDQFHCEKGEDPAFLCPPEIFGDQVSMELKASGCSPRISLASLVNGHPVPKLSFLAREGANRGRVGYFFNGDIHSFQVQDLSL